MAISLLDQVRRRVGVRRDYESLYALGVAFTAYAAAEAVGGSGFLAAFAAGVTAEKFRPPSGLLNTHETIQAEYAVWHAKVESARAWVRRAFTTIFETVRAGGTATDAQEADCRLVATQVAFLAGRLRVGGDIRQVIDRGRDLALLDELLAPARAAPTG